MPHTGPFHQCLPALLALLVIASSCSAFAAEAPSDPKAIANRRFDAMAQLPAGEGKDLTAIACSRCHDLAGLAAYKGYWSRAQWLAMVESMVKNGAVLDAAQMNLVTDYLNNNYGRQPASQ
ncbi:MAG: hypothetical protein V4603_12100 [Pseudomonadota bacterium]